MRPDDTSRRLIPFRTPPHHLPRQADEPSSPSDLDEKTDVVIDRSEDIEWLERYGTGLAQYR